LTKKQLTLIGIAAGAAGLYFFAGPQIKDFFKGKQDESETGEVDEKIPTLPPGNVAPTSQVLPKEKSIDINKKLRKGSNGEEVKRLQFIINYIAGLRGTTSYKTPAGYVVKFPIGTDGDFGNNSQAGAYFAFNSFKDDGYVTLDTAREKLAYIAGYYDKPFPSELVGTTNYSKYQTKFKAGQIDGNKTTLPGGGINLIPGVTIFNP
jgi:hypothetical protein